MICSKCGLENAEGSIFCNKCGTSITTEQKSVKKNNFVRNVISRIIKISTKKKIILGVLLLSIIVAGVGYKILEPPSPQKVFEKVKDYKTEEALSYFDEVYPSNGGFLGLFKEKNNQNKQIVLSLSLNNIENQFQATFGRSISDYNAVKISHVEIKDKSYSSDYINIDVTVENAGTTPVNYIKINLYFKDDNGNIVKSDWTNDDSVIRPGASQVITKMMELDGWTQVSAEIAEVR